MRGSLPGRHVDDDGDVHREAIGAAACWSSTPWRRTERSGTFSDARTACPVKNAGVKLWRVSMFPLCLGHDHSQHGPHFTHTSRAIPTILEIMVEL